MVKAVPEGYLCEKQVADELGISVQKLRYWRTEKKPPVLSDTAKKVQRLLTGGKITPGPKEGKESYYPEPLHQDGYLLFTKKQLLLKDLVRFFAKYGSRTWRTGQKKLVLKELVASIHARWEG